MTESEDRSCTCH